MSEEIAINVSVTIGMPVGKPIPPRTSFALFETGRCLGEMRIRGELAMNICGVIQIARDTVLDEFLKNGTDKLFWIDSDMVWTPHDFLRLLALSTRYDIVGAAYPVKVDGPETFHVNTDGLDVIQVNTHGLMGINGLGLGFTVVSRRACEFIASKSPRVIESNGREMAEVFRVDKTAAGHRRTEDIAFFADLREAGFSVWCDPSIELGHVGEREWRGRLADALPAAAEAA